MARPPSSEWFFFDPAERALVERALAFVDAANAEQAGLLTANLARLQGLAELLTDSASLASSWRARGGKGSADESLIDLLCRVPEYDIDLHLPTKALLGQTYLIAKINFLKGLGYALESLDSPAELSQRIELEVGQSIYSKLAEELFVSIVTSPDTPRDAKAGAARFLFRIWDQRLLVEVDDFAPLLESVWQARTKLLPVLGTMLGTQEVFQLVRETSDSRFLDYFTSDGVAEEQVFAFEEFLFGLSFEDIQKLREHLAAEGKAYVTIEEARALLSNQRGSWRPDASAAQSLYTSYKKRRVKALYRAITSARGPKKTAEEYIMIAFLQAGSTPSSPAIAAASPRLT
jgi:hypothetical protein